MKTSNHLISDINALNDNQLDECLTARDLLESDDLPPGFDTSSNVFYDRRRDQVMIINKHGDAAAMTYIEDNLSPFAGKNFGGPIYKFVPLHRTKKGEEYSHFELLELYFKNALSSEQEYREVEQIVNMLTLSYRHLPVNAIRDLVDQIDNWADPTFWITLSPSTQGAEIPDGIFIKMLNGIETQFIEMISDQQGQDALLRICKYAKEQKYKYLFIELFDRDSNDPNRINLPTYDYELPLLRK